MTPGDYQRLRDMFEQEREALETERRRFRQLMSDVDLEDCPVDWRHTENVASRLEEFYTGIERILLRIAKAVDQQKPAGDNWHKTLLSQMAESTDDRPPVVDEELHRDLTKLRKFRHVKRHRYGHELDWELMESHVERFHTTFEDAIDAIEACFESLAPTTESTGD